MRRFAKDVYPQLNKEYIETGKAKIIFREFPLDGAARMASAVARCLAVINIFLSLISCSRIG